VQDIRQEVLAQGLIAQISGTTIRRWLSRDALCPWRHRTWIFPRDPRFVRKAGDFVLSAGEKTSIQARRRIHASMPPAPGRPARIQHEYERRAKVLTPGDCANLADLEMALLAFQHRYEKSAVPFRWTFTRADPVNLMQRLKASALPAAA
jgi:hypothetical protein